MNPQIANQYNKIRHQYSQYLKKYVQMEDQKKEHQLVYQNLKGLSSNRKCWKKIGGVLIQKTHGQTITILQQNIKMIDQAIEGLSTMLKQSQNKIHQIQLKYGIKKQDQKQ